MTTQQRPEWAAARQRTAKEDLDIKAIPARRMNDAIGRLIADMFGDLVWAEAGALPQRVQVSGYAEPEGAETERLAEIFQGYQAEAAEIFRDRQTKYGPSNIATSYGGAMNGLIVRMGDKMARLRNLHQNGRGRDAPDESVTDTLNDLANYALIARMVLEGQWPGVDEDAEPFKVNYQEEMDCE
ncbi:hypothetical protein Lfu02_55280 [Longispora fulva]|uniref:Nucleotide modification associated domain-containing protein n=1 Tax=Longispora fulva TaxID=619741 RepID=A0A8J7GUB6_9ACTN|nr:nucleotide modification associated domain-containing protein [Longispora fulva]MBG6137491.1 hypothetical protein [Longispora fulva]GIG61156.1 hypothetical protein Lfu02_55280 [Longispora fulva]